MEQFGGILASVEVLKRNNCKHYEAISRIDGSRVENRS